MDSGHESTIITCQTVIESWRCILRQVDVGLHPAGSDLTFVLIVRRSCS